MLGPEPVLELLGLPFEFVLVLELVLVVLEVLVRRPVVVQGIVVLLRVLPEGLRYVVVALVLLPVLVLLAREELYQVLLDLLVMILRRGILLLLN